MFVGFDNYGDHLKTGSDLTAERLADHIGLAMHMKFLVDVLDMTSDCFNGDGSAAGNHFIT